MQKVRTGRSYQTDWNVSAVSPTRSQLDSQDISVTKDFSSLMHHVQSINSFFLIFSPESPCSLLCGTLRCMGLTENNSGHLVTLSKKEKKSESVKTRQNEWSVNLGNIREQILRAECDQYTRYKYMWTLYHVWIWVCVWESFWIEREIVREFLNAR